MHVWLLLFALGTLLFFPRLAKALVALGLLGCLVMAGFVGYKILDMQLQEARDRQRDAQKAAQAQAEADYAFLKQRHDAGLDQDNLAAQSCVLNGTRLMFVEIRDTCRQAMLQIREVEMAKYERLYGLQAHPNPSKP